MRTTIILSSMMFFLSISACGQEERHQEPAEQKITSKTKTMDLSKITHPTVKSAIGALRSGDKSWYGFFIQDPVMTDDGNVIDFRSFFDHALGNEKFLSIDKVENEGKDVYGSFKAGNWGTFKVFFKFHINEEGKFHRLDIGQAKY